ncbi:putative tick til 11 [Operophtera brumata]|uniref:Putative tick til 11 n=1 Tax=Operophtera brumata TaxID=104452 RepID=A0A0L7LVF7_OPEBR|nr:putative tick til 11 [Operophtera brumata]
MKIKGGETCPAGEIYEKCSQIHCYKNCGHLKNQPACPSVTADCYNPACECDGDTLRNAQGVCIPTKQCPEWIGN